MPFYNTIDDAVPYISVVEAHRYLRLPQMLHALGKTIQEQDVTLSAVSIGVDIVDPSLEDD